MAKIVVSTAMYNMVSPEQSVLVALFMIFNRAIPMGAFSLFALPLSDIADQDMLINSRPHSMSSTIFGLNAFFTKPAQSIGPMLVFSILRNAGYEPQ